MAKQYNVNIVGSLTNTNGVLSNFSSSNYATFKVFAPGQNAYEIVAKFNFNNASTEQMIYYFGDYNANFGTLSLRVDQGNIYVFFGQNSNPYWDIRGNTTLQANTDYWVKLTFDGNNSYNLYLSTDGTTYSIDGSNTQSYYLKDNNTIASQIGTYAPPNGSIDLNECYIKVNNAYWWKGVTNTTHIQLRRDTASNWNTVDPTLYEGEVGLETDTGKFKIGDGSNSYQNLPYARAIDGQYTAKYLQIDSTKTAHAISADLSTYINDSTTASYEVLVELNIASNNTTYLFAGNVASPYTNQHGNAFCVGTNTTSGATQAHMACWVPLATSSRTLYCQLGGSSASSSADINLLGYRRLGTNS